ncbi:MAG: hypothetical protein K6E96_09165 [Bacteroidales bacterium]|nr:hypothetical protein [Bacteroidales bacterium]
MNRKHIILTLAALVGLTLAACQQETPVIPTPGTTSGTEASTVSYTVDGKPWQVSYDDEDELKDLIVGMMAYVRDDHTLVLSGEMADPAAVPTKGVVTFRTASDTAAAAWATEKYLQGYTVTVTFDAETQEYVCRAEIKSVAQQPIPISLAETKWRYDLKSNPGYFMLFCDTDSTCFYITSNGSEEDSVFTTYTYESETGICILNAEPFLDGVSSKDNEPRFVMVFEYSIVLNAFLQYDYPYKRVNPSEY